MNTFRKFQILGAFLFLLAFASCDKKEIADPINPDDYPTATFTSDFSGSEITEGSTITYTIELDKPYNVDMTFDLEFKDGSVAGDHDISYSPVTIPAYSKTGQMVISIPDDMLPEETEALKFEVGIFDVGHRYMLNPKTVQPVVEVNVKNAYDPDNVVVAMGWVNDDHDMDIFTISADNGDWALQATGDNPEIMTAIASTDPDGVYYITVDPYHVEGNVVNYTFRIGYPNGEVDVITGIFDVTKIADYTIDHFAYWGIDTYRLVEITKAGTQYSAASAN